MRSSSSIKRIRTISDQHANEKDTVARPKRYSAIFQKTLIQLANKCPFLTDRWNMFSLPRAPFLAVLIACSSPAQQNPNATAMTLTISLRDALDRARQH